MRCGKARTSFSSAKFVMERRRRAAFYAAETGHLVLGTLHADRVLEIPSRLLNLLPAEDKAQGRYVLSKVAKAFVSQRLLRLREGGRVAAREILLHVRPCLP